MATRPAAAAVAPSAGDFVSRLLAFRGRNPGLSPVEVVRAFVAAQAPSDLAMDDSARSVAALRGADRRRMAMSTGSDAGARVKDQPFQRAFDVGHAAEGMGYETKTFAPVMAAQMEAVPGVAAGLRPGDEFFFYFDGCGDGDPPIRLFTYNEGYSSASGFHVSRFTTLFALGEARGVNMVAVFATTTANIEAPTQAEAPDGPVAPLPPALVEAGEYIDAIDRADRLSEASRQKLASEGSQVFLTATAAGQVLYEKDSLAERLLEFRAMHPSMPLNELLAAFQLGGMTRDKVYHLAASEESKLIFFDETKNIESMPKVVTIYLSGRCGARVKEFLFNLDELSLGGRGNKGTLVTQYPIRDVKRA